MDSKLTDALDGGSTTIPEPEPPSNFYVDRPWTWRDRLRSKLMPRRFCDLPTLLGASSYGADVIEVHTIVGLDWKDRLRVLVTGHLEVRNRIVTEHVCGATKAASVAYPIWTP